jgi:hypothetical protein
MWLLPAVEFFGSGYERAARTGGNMPRNPEKGKKTLPFPAHAANLVRREDR